MATAKWGAQVLVPGAWIGCVCLSLPPRGARKQPAVGQDPHARGSKLGSLHWSEKQQQSLVLPSQGWEGHEEVAACRLSEGNARLLGRSCPQPWRSRGSQPALCRLAGWLLGVLAV